MTGIVEGRDKRGRKLDLLGVIDAIAEAEDPRVLACLDALADHGITGATARDVAAHVVQAVVLGYDDEPIQAIAWRRLDAHGCGWFFRGHIDEEAILACHAVAVALGLQEEVPRLVPRRINRPGEGLGGYRRRMVAA